MLPVDHLFDAFLAECMAALGDCGCLHSAHADWTVELLEDGVDFNFDLESLFFELRHYKY